MTQNTRTSSQSTSTYNSPVFLTIRTVFWFIGILIVVYGSWQIFIGTVEVFERFILIVGCLSLTISYAMTIARHIYKNESCSIYVICALIFLVFAFGQTFIIGAIIG